MKEEVQPDAGVDGFYAPRDPNVFTMFTVYNHPSDFPDHFVVRRGFATRKVMVHTPFYRLGTTLEEVRRQIPQGFDLIMPDPEDDPVIVEIWI
jgi:hypothetical protein